MIPVFPIEDPILIFAIAMVVFLVAPLVLVRYRAPGIVGILLVGAAVGPNGLGLLDRDATFVLLGEVGIVYLMFLAALEIDVDQFIEFRARSIVFGTLSFLIPQIGGTFVGMWMFGFDLPTALLFAAIFASHTLLAYPVVNRLGIATRESVTVTIGGTILTDTLALLVLAIVLGSTGVDPAGISFWAIFAIGLAVFFVGVWVLVPRIATWFFRTVDEESYFEFLFVMSILFVSAWIASEVGIEAIVGAFLCGLAINRQIPDVGPLMNRIEFVGNALFIPFFLLSVGMLIDVRVLLDGIETISITIALIVLVVTTKYLAAAVAARWYGYGAAERLTMFGLSLGQAAAALAIVLVGYDAGFFGDAVLNGTIVMILVVSVVSPLVVDRYGRDIARAMEVEPYDPAAVDHRVMLPVTPGVEYPDNLLDVGTIIRHRPSESLYVLTVVEPGPDLEERVTEIEASLERTARYGAASEVSIETRTRLNRTPASGIVDAVLENRITTLVIGWDGAASRRQSVFGGTIDRVLARTQQLAFVCRVREPLGITEEMIVVLPPGIAYNPGFAEAIHQIKRIASALHASVRVLPVGALDERAETVLASVGPDLSVSIDQASDWEGLIANLDAEATPTTLVVPLSARRGTMGWDRALETLPKQVSERTEGNFLVVYPATDEDRVGRRFLRFT